jgi:hypothetical protein
MGNGRIIIRPYARPAYPRMTAALFERLQHRFDRLFAATRGDHRVGKLLTLTLTAQALGALGKERELRPRVVHDVGQAVTRFDQALDTVCPVGAMP